MFKSYLTIAYRNFLKYKGYSGINILGLSIGMASCIMISLFVNKEISYDKWIPNGENVYRYETNYISPEGNFILAKSPFRAKRDLKQYFSDIIDTVRIIDAEVLLSVGNKKSTETVWFADQELFSVLDLPLVSGNKKTALNDNNSILISEFMANKYFPNRKAVGNTITFDNQRDYKVVGIFKDIPENSQFNFDFIAKYNQSDEMYGFGYNESWDSIEGYTYLTLPDGYDHEIINKNFLKFAESLYPPDFFGAGAIIKDNLQLSLLPLYDVHLAQDRVGEIREPGSIILVYTFSAIAVLILVLACINFLNLTTNRSFQRAREATIRKVLGASRKLLVIQFLGESLFLSVLSLIVALMIVEMMLPWYSAFLGYNMEVEYFTNIKNIILIFGLAIAVGIVGGLYPAYTLSSYRPARILRSNQSNVQAGSSILRTGLVTFQYIISIALIILTMVVSAQKDFVDSKDVGFSKENKIVIRNIKNIPLSQKNFLGNEISKIDSIEKVAFSTATPSDRMSIYRDFKVIGSSNNKAVELALSAVGYDFFDTYNIPLIYGRDFSMNFPKDEFLWIENDEGAITRSSAIINQNAVKALGFNDKETALGKVIIFETFEFEIIGVVDNFNFQSLRTPLFPSVYVLNKEDHFSLTILYSKDADVSKMMHKISMFWKNNFPEIPFIYQFVDENIESQYDIDMKAGTLMSLFSIIAILIALLGLYALTSYSIQRRTKEIGIRKVHGATTQNIIVMFLRQFSMPLIISNIFAWPLAFYCATMYLNTFYYRINIGISYFLIATFSGLLIAWLTIFSYSLSFAKAKPNSALRYE